MAVAVEACECKAVARCECEAAARHECEGRKAETGGSRKARTRGCRDLGSWLSTGSVPMLRGRGITSAAMERITRSVTEQRPHAILLVHKFSVLCSGAWGGWMALVDATRSAVCQHADKSCQPCYSDKGVMVCEHCLQCKMHCSHVGGVMVNMPTTNITALTVRNGAEIVADTLDRQAQTVTNVWCIAGLPDTIL